MTGNLLRAPARNLTHTTPFYAADEKSQLLFEVRAGIDTETATAHAVDILQTAHTVLVQTNDTERNDHIDAATRLIDMGIALVRACETPPGDGEIGIDMKTLANQHRLEIAYTLLRELRLAGDVIVNALQIMTPEQKAAWAAANERTDCIGEGVTRRNERDAAIKLAIAILGEGEHHD